MNNESRLKSSVTEHDHLLWQILDNENYYRENTRQFFTDLTSVISALLISYNPTIELETLSDEQYNRLGYILCIVTIFLQSYNQNRQLKIFYTNMVKRKTHCSFFHLDRIPPTLNDDLAKQWNLISSAHPIEIEKAIKHSIKNQESISNTRH